MTDRSRPPDPTEAAALSDLETQIWARNLFTSARMMRRIWPDPASLSLSPLPDFVPDDWVRGDGT